MSKHPRRRRGRKRKKPAVASTVSSVAPLPIAQPVPAAQLSLATIRDRLRQFNQRNHLRPLTLSTTPSHG